MMTIMKLAGSMAITLLATPVLVLATPARRSALETRAAPDNTVHITSTTDFCMVVPRNPHTNIGDSEHPGGETVYCSAAGRSSDSQGLLPDNFWRSVTLKEGNGWIQLTGCINPGSVDRLNPGDGGGQYDSSGGDGGRGNPAGSVCTGYNHYVELIEPAGDRACIRCCKNPGDCPVTRDTQGCASVIPGNYNGC